MVVIFSKLSFPRQSLIILSFSLLFSHAASGMFGRKTLILANSFSGDTLELCFPSVARAKIGHPTNIDSKYRDMVRAILEEIDTGDNSQIPVLKMSNGHRNAFRKKHNFDISAVVTGKQIFVNDEYIDTLPDNEIRYFMLKRDLYHFSFKTYYMNGLLRTTALVGSFVINKKVQPLVAKSLEKGVSFASRFVGRVPEKEVTVSSGGSSSGSSWTSFCMNIASLLIVGKVVDVIQVKAQNYLLDWQQGKIDERCLAKKSILDLKVLAYVMEVTADSLSSEERRLRTIRAPKSDLEKANKLLCEWNKIQGNFNVVEKYLNAALVKNPNYSEEEELKGLIAAIRAEQRDSNQKNTISVIISAYDNAYVKQVSKSVIENHIGTLNKLTKSLWNNPDSKLTHKWVTQQLIDKLIIKSNSL